jgi:hypothetical protein
MTCRRVPSTDRCGDQKDRRGRYGKGHDGAKPRSRSEATESSTKCRPPRARRHAAPPSPRSRYASGATTAKPLPRQRKRGRVGLPLDGVVATGPPTWEVGPLQTSCRSTATPRPEPVRPTPRARSLRRVSSSRRLVRDRRARHDPLGSSRRWRAMPITRIASCRSHGSRALVRLISPRAHTELVRSLPVRSLRVRSLESSHARVP